MTNRYTNLDRKRGSQKIKNHKKMIQREQKLGRTKKKERKGPERKSAAGARELYKVKDRR